MATSGSGTTNTYYNQSNRQWNFTLSWSVSSWSGNTATISWKVTCNCNGRYQWTNICK